MSRNQMEKNSKLYFWEGNIWADWLSAGQPLPQITTKNSGQNTKKATNWGLWKVNFRATSKKRSNKITKIKDTPKSPSNTKAGRKGRREEQKAERTHRKQTIKC